MDMSLWRVLYEHGHYPKKILGVFHGYLRRLCDMFRLHKFDVVYIPMWVTPLGPALFERLTRFLIPRVIYDIEDNVLIEQTLPSKLWPNAIARFFKGASKARFLIRTSDHVITSSPFLNDYCLKKNKKKKCTYISSSVDTDRFLPATSYSNDKPVVIGWTGTFSTRIYLDMLRSVFQELAQRVPFNLKIIGNFDYMLDGVDMEVVRWTSEREVADLQTFDIGVYPLPINNWVLGKSGLKAIQYMAFGLPCVATDVGTSSMLITDRINGRLVKTNDQWIEALEELIRDEKLRYRLGTQARADAVANYSLRTIGKQYNKILKDVMSR